jgi:hypothetical protein
MYGRVKHDDLDLVSVYEHTASEATRTLGLTSRRA